ncbi:MAG: hydroxymethylbilane synthase, partial [Akkermansiaceae bacterium]|nr:hydroxymethylbilane synthase [Akkermansiaceae bacterium]
DAREFLPAAGQGAVALEVRSGDGRMRELAEAVNDAATLDAVSAERKFLELLGAGCETPVGVWSEIAGEELNLRVRV